MIETGGVDAVVEEMEEPSALPEDLESWPPGVQLAALLASVDRAGLGAGDLLRLARARARLVAHQQAQLTADLHQVAHTTPDQGDQPGRRDLPGKYPWAEVDVAFAMCWSNAKAGSELELADEVIDTLPRVHAAWEAGLLDRARVWVICQAVTGLEAQVARAVVDHVLDQAPRWTTGQLAARLRRLVIAADPHAAARRARNQIKGRRVAAYLNDNQLAALCGYELAPHRVAAAMERMTAIARAAKAAGDPRRIDQLRADVLLDLLVGDGIATGGPITDGGLGTDHTTTDQSTSEPHTGRGTSRGPSGADTTGSRSRASATPTGHHPVTGEVTGTQAGTADPAGSAPVPVQAYAPDTHTPWPQAPADPHLALPDPEPPTVTPETAPPPEPTTKPGEPPPDYGGPGTDPEHEQLRELWYAGFDQLPTTPPPGTRTPATTTAALPAPRKGVIDLQVPLTTLIGLSNLPGDLDGWGPVIADICRQITTTQPHTQWRYSTYDHTGQLTHHGITHTRPNPPQQQHQQRRRPTATDTAYIKARDRTCRAPGCNRTARHCDIDHTLDWATSNDSRPCNLACLCRKHHLYKHTSGAQLIQLAPGTLGWTTPTGLQHTTHPPAYPTELEPPNYSHPNTTNHQNPNPNPH